MKTGKRMALWYLICSIFLLMPFYTASASENLLPSASNNLQVRLRRMSDIVPVNDGYMRVYYNGSRIGIEYYDNNFVIKSKKSLAMELNLWGGFYAGANAYYLVEGQSNTSENDSAEVIRVIKYSTSWQKLGTANITGNPELFGGEVRYPFDVGCVEMTESGGTLYIVTGHEGYVDAAVGQGHQGFLMIAVNEAAMTGKIVSSDLWHSFAQYIKSKGNDLYVLEQSEGSRCMQLSKYDTNTMQRTSLNVFKYGGSRDSAWAVPCYASVDGMALSADYILALGTSIDQSKYDVVSEDTAHNIYLSVTPMSDFSEAGTKVKWLTNYSGGGKCFLETKITKINDNRFMVSWEEYDSEGTASPDDSLSASVLHYVFVDGKGDKISREYTESTPISDCQPVVKDSKVTYYASNENTVNFYSIDSETGKTSKKQYRVAGENATWSFSKGVLTISGSGAIEIDTKENTRFPVSSTQSWFVSSSSDNVWKPVRDQTKKIVISSGITSIPESAFSYFSNLGEVVIEPGLKSIGAEAFYGCTSLTKITIPSSVSQIGADILWTGYTWTGSGKHVVSATICAGAGSYAEKYAKNNAINYAIDISGAKVKSLKASYVYSGKKIKPAVTVVLGGKTLKADRDYSVAYKSNTEVGTAKLTITGQGEYGGTITLTFKIVSPTKGAAFTDSKTGNSYLITGTKNTVAFAGAKKNRTTVTVPGTVKLGSITYQVKSIADSAFKNNKSLKKVIISRKITSIGTKAFYGCKKLSSVTIGGDVTTIKGSAFENCTALKKITIPSKVKTIGTKAFYNCTKLTSVTVKTTKLTAKTVGSRAFTKAGKSNYRKSAVKVPKKKYSSYKKLLVKKGLSPKVKIKK